MKAVGYIRVSLDNQRKRFSLWVYMNNPCHLEVETGEMLDVPCQR